ncbi:MAG: hypothetical protein ACKVZH_15100 [Blastocatellia bacterium]
MKPIILVPLVLLLVLGVSSYRRSAKSSPRSSNVQSLCAQRQQLVAEINEYNGQMNFNQGLADQAGEQMRGACGNGSMVDCGHARGLGQGALQNARTASHQLTQAQLRLIQLDRTLGENKSQCR